MILPWWWKVLEALAPSSCRTRGRGNHRPVESWWWAFRDSLRSWTARRWPPPRPLCRRWIPVPRQCPWSRGSRDCPPGGRKRKKIIFRRFNNTNRVTPFYCFVCLEDLCDPGRIHLFKIQNPHLNQCLMIKCWKVVWLDTRYSSSHDPEIYTHHFSNWCVYWSKNLSWYFGVPISSIDNTFEGVGLSMTLCELAFTSSLSSLQSCHHNLMLCANLCINFSCIK